VCFVVLCCASGVLMVGVVFFDYWVSVGVAVVYPFSLLVLNSSIDFFCK